MLRLVDDTTTAVKTEDVVADAARPSRLHLVFVSEKLLTGVAAAVVKLSVSKDAEQRALTGIDISHYCHPAISTT